MSAAGATVVSADSDESGTGSTKESAKTSASNACVKEFAKGVICMFPTSDVGEAPDIEGTVASSLKVRDAVGTATDEAGLMEPCLVSEPEGGVSSFARLWSHFS